MFKRMTEAFSPGDDDTDLGPNGTNENPEYTDDAICSFCGTELDGAAFQCAKCNLLTCG
jgi:hypothetical protein